MAEAHKPLIPAASDREAGGSRLIGITLGLTRPRLTWVIVDPVSKNRTKITTRPLPPTTREKLDPFSFGVLGDGSVGYTTHDNRYSIPRILRVERTTPAS